MQKWTQEESATYEYARDAIGAGLAIISARIHDELEQSRFDSVVVLKLKAKRSRLFRERAKLHINNQAKIARIRAGSRKIPGNVTNK